MRTIRTERTAIRRRSLSRPVALAFKDGLICQDHTFFDYGCGRGDDLLRLNKMGIRVAGWDPAFFPDEARTPASVVNLGYVINVIEDPNERAVVLTAAWNLARKALIVAARLDWEATDAAVNFQGDGVVTGKRTFQKFFTQEELRRWIERVLDRRPVAAAPGIFYVFRDEADAQSFTLNRVVQRQRLPDIDHCPQLVVTQAKVLEPLIAFVQRRGRLPVAGELSTAPQLKQLFGSVARAFSMVRRVTPRDQWDRVMQERREDLLVYLALSAFPKRPPFSLLPADLRYDVRVFFGSYRAGCAEANALLFSAGDGYAVDQACEKATVGKLLPDALYVHRTALDELPPLLRVYEGCGRQLAGSVDGLTIVKLFRRRPRVSYLTYEDFDRVAHPALCSVVIADLRRLAIHHRDYTQTANPPVLHRKELFVSANYPGRSRFARLTEREEELGLLRNASTIGTMVGWLAVLAHHGVSIRGHRVYRQQ